MQNSSQIQEHLVSEADKHPRIFVWKTIALVITALIAVVIVINLCMLIYLNENPVPPTNLTFLNDLIINSKIVNKIPMLSTLISNLARIHPNIKFQTAVNLYQGNGNQFTAETVKDKIFRHENTNLLFIFETVSKSQKSYFGFYSTASFPIPDADDFNKNIEYYTFQFGDSRHSSIFSLETENLIMANSNNDKVTEDPIKCKSYLMKENQNYFSILDLLEVTLDTNSTISLRNISENYICFDNMQKSEDLSSQLKRVIGYDLLLDDVSIQNFEVYYLKE